MQAVILSIGDELVLGQTVDTNSAWLAAKLTAIGVPCLYHQTVADDLPAITRAIDLACRSAKLVLISGGLGPTEDDLTREALAGAMGVDLVEDEAALATLRGFFEGRGRTMPERNRVQAMTPRGASAIPNANGTAPGIRAVLHGALVYVMPGVPREMKGMYDASIEPEVLAMGSGTRGVILTTKVNTFGIGESNVSEILGPQLMHRDRNPKVGTTVAEGVVSVRLRSEFATREEAQRQLDETLSQVRGKLGAVVYGTDDETMAQSVVQLLVAQGKRVVTAESCTGGLIGKMLTDVAGSSAAYHGGWVCYSNDVKINELDVPATTIAQHGAVSEATVRALAENALRRAELGDFSLAVTGIAGPDGGTPDKPVGSVWIALGVRGKSGDISVTPLLLRLSGDRDAIRDRSAKNALQMLRLHLLGQPLSLLQWTASPTQPAAAKA